MTMFRVTLSIAVVVSLAACGSTGSGYGGTVRANAPSGQKVGASIVVKIPHRNNKLAVARYLSNASIAAGRGRAYLSPDSASIAISVTDSSNHSTTVYASLSVTAPGSGPNPAECTSTALSTICTIALALQPGTYSGNFATYDGALDSNNMPTGNVLSQNQNVPFTVAAGKLNQLIVSLAAVPAGVTIAPAFDEKLVRGNQANGFSLLVTGTTHTFNVAALDADGDVIIGPGAPTYSLSLPQSVDTYVTVLGPFAAHPNSFTFKTTKPLSGGFPKDPQGTPPLSMTLQAVPPAGAGVVCSAACSRSVTIDSIDAFFADFGTQSGVFAPGEASAFATDVTESVASAVDASGDVFFASGSSVYEWSPPYDSPAVQLFTESSVPNIPDIAVSPTGTVYYDGITDSTTTPFTFSAFFSRPPYTSHTNFLSGLTFSSPIANQSRLLADANDKVIIADDNQVLVTDSELSAGQQSFSTPKAQLVFDPAGELIVFDPSAQTMTAYTFDTGTGKYVAGVTNTNASYEVPMRAGGSSIYLPRRGSNQIALFASPLTTNAPTLENLAGTNTYGNFVVTNDGTGVAKIGNQSSLLEEIFGIGAASPDTIEANGGGGTGETLLAIH